MEKWEKIKVDKKVKAVHFKQRKAVELIVGNEYFISFGCNEANRCVLNKIKENNQIEIGIYLKPTKKIHHEEYKELTSIHTVYLDEIGLTPEEAVINEVTN